MPRSALGVWSGVGLVAANMIGTGVFVSAAFMAQDMGPGTILMAWVVGMALAMAGAFAYAEVARLVPHSGGEYRYLSELIHPSLGYLAGWASLLVGFSAPLAINASGASAYLDKVIGIDHPRLLATLLIALLTAAHCIGLKSSKRTQNLLIAIKILLLTGFIGLGLTMGDNSWPTWTPPGGGAFQLSIFMGSLFYIAFAFSGWNAAVYAADEFEKPARDVPKAMLLGCLLVGLGYLVFNWVFVANLDPSEAARVMDHKSTQITLGHAVTEKLIGPIGGKLMSVVAAIAFMSAMSAMIMVGPRVYAVMAKDGFLPAILRGRDGHPPIGSIVFQSAVAVSLIWLQSTLDTLETAGVILVLFSATTVLSLFAVSRTRPDLGAPRRASQAAGVLYVGSAAWMLYFGFRDNMKLLVGTAAMAALGLIGYVLTSRQKAARASAAKE